MENHNNNDLEDLNNLMQEQEQRRKEKVVKNKKANELLLADKRYQKIIADIKVLDNKKDKIIAKILSENIK
jgi:hypothetical protein